MTNRDIIQPSIDSSDTLTSDLPDSEEACAQLRAYEASMRREESRERKRRAKALRRRSPPFDDDPKRDGDGAAMLRASQVEGVAAEELGFFINTEPFDEASRKARNVIAARVATLSAEQQAAVARWLDPKLAVLATEESELVRAEWDYTLALRAYADARGREPSALAGVDLARARGRRGGDEVTTSTSTSIAIDPDDDADVVPDTLRVITPEDTVRAVVNGALGHLGNDELLLVARIAEGLRAGHGADPRSFSRPGERGGPPSREVIEATFDYLAFTWARLRASEVTL